MPPKGRIHDPQIRRILADRAPRLVHFEPMAADVDYFDSTTLAGGTGGETLAIAAGDMTLQNCPIFPVVPTVTVVEVSGSDYTAVASTITGWDQFGDFISETAAGVDSADTWTCTFLHAFRKLYSCSTTVTGDTAADDTHTIGFAKTYGLGERIASATDVITKHFDGAADAGTVSAVYHTYVIAGTPDAAKAVEWLVVPGYYLVAQK